MSGPVSLRPWDRAALPVSSGARRRPELRALPPGAVTLPTLFTFMRDAELRFRSLRLRIEDRTATAGGERLEVTEVLLRHPEHARVTTTVAGDRAAGGGYTVWVCDGREVATYSARSGVTTRRPVRRPLVGLDSPDLPGRSRVYRPLTALPTESLADAFVHPAGFCQNVLATGACMVAGGDAVAGREAILVLCDHPRTTEVTTDRADHRLAVSVDATTGIIVRLVETVAERETRRAEVTGLDTDPEVADAAFDLVVPESANRVY